MFTAEDNAFLRAILDIPEDRNTWLIYADWLDDRGDPRAEFLRLAVTQRLMTEDDPARPEIDARLTQLRAELHPQWMMMFDTAPVGNCHGCHWGDLTATDVPDIRICHRCKEAVIYCHTLDEARQYASCGQRVALSTRILAEDVAREPAFQEDAPEPELVFDVEDAWENYLPAVAPPRATPAARRRRWWKFW
ncbi:MAG TPA: TIGR02996 domain-containing protein [Gemmata sp.]|nr:TIGR02996 domain-containing protein [Gemmata sp.]